MTDAQWDAEHTKLQSKLTKTRNKAKKAGDLASKVALFAEAKSYEEALRQHRLTKFEQVSA